jgi:signal transduction histidine kinase
MVLWSIFTKQNHNDKSHSLFKFHSNCQIDEKSQQFIPYLFFSIIGFEIFWIKTEAAFNMSNLILLIFITSCIIAHALTYQTSPHISKGYFILISIIYPPLTRFSSEIHTPTMIVSMYYFIIGSLILSDNLIFPMILSFFEIFYACIWYIEDIAKASWVTHSETIARRHCMSHALIMSFLAVLIVLLYKRIFKLENKLHQIRAKQCQSEIEKTALLSLSHELRNSINIVKGNIELCMLEKAPKKFEEYLQNAKLGGEMLLNLVNNFLDSTKLDYGDLDLSTSQLDIKENLKNIWKIFAPCLTKKNLNGRLLFAGIPKFLKLDQIRLNQIMFNLIQNAIKFTTTGNIKVLVEWSAEKKNIDSSNFYPHPFGEDGIFEKNYNIFASDRDNRDLSHGNMRNEPGILKITVLDSGVGIEENKVQNLFKKFSQVGCDSQNKRMGTGLGLYITKELCEKMGGQIKAFSNYGRGTAFVFCLPVKM